MFMRDNVGHVIWSLSGNKINTEKIIFISCKTVLLLFFIGHMIVFYFYDLTMSSAALQ